MLDNTMHQGPGIVVGCHVFTSAKALNVLKLVLCLAFVHSYAWLCAGHCKAMEDMMCLLSGSCAEADPEISPTIGKPLSKYINQIMKKNNTLNQHGVNAAYKSLHYWKPRRYCNYPQVLWNRSKMHSLVKCATPDVEKILRPFLDFIPENSIYVATALSHFLKYLVECEGPGREHQRSWKWLKS